jgi:hypothetical protein
LYYLETKKLFGRKLRKEGKFTIVSVRVSEPMKREADQHRSINIREMKGRFSPSQKLPRREKRVKIVFSILACMFALRNEYSKKLTGEEGGGDGCQRQAHTTQRALSISTSSNNFTLKENEWSKQKKTSFALKMSISSSRLKMS